MATSTLTQLLNYDLSHGHACSQHLGVKMTDRVAQPSCTIKPRTCIPKQNCVHLDLDLEKIFVLLCSVAADSVLDPAGGERKKMTTILQWHRQKSKQKAKT